MEAEGDFWGCGSIDLDELEGRGFVEEVQGYLYERKEKSAGRVCVCVLVESLLGVVACQEKNMLLLCLLCAL